MIRSIEHIFTPCAIGRVAALVHSTAADCYIDAVMSTALKRRSSRLTVRLENFRIQVSAGLDIFPGKYFVRTGQQISKAECAGLMGKGGL